MVTAYYEDAAVTIYHGDCRDLGEHDALDEGECQTCDQDRLHGGPKPPHDASRRCQSGARTHCTCERCF